MTKRMSVLWLVGIVGLMVRAELGANEIAHVELPTHLRRPVALVLSPDGSRAFVANRRSGTISVVDLATEQTVAEFPIGKQLSDLERDRTGQRLIALDDAAHELIVIEVSQDAAQPKLKVVQRLAVPPYPVRVILSADGLQAYVSSLWSRQLSIVRWGDETAAAKIEATIDLPFAPRELLLIPEKERLIVADSFGGQLGIVYPPLAKLLLVQSMPAHQIRGLRLTADRQKLIVVHQMLNEKAQSIQSDVHWGLLMSNDLRWLKLDSVLYKSDTDDTHAGLYRGGHVHPLGEPGRGGGDPSAVDVAADGTVIVTLGGTGDIALGKEEDFSFYKIRGGRGSAEYGDEYYTEADGKGTDSRRPVDILFAPDGRRAYAVDMFRDALTVVNIGEREISKHISLGPGPKERSLVDRGEQLFFDSHLSHDGWMSCNSCHVDGHSNGNTNDNQSDGGFGGSKRVLSLLGQRDTAPYAWLGGVSDLRQQAHSSLVKTMQSKREPAEEELDALTAFMGTLELPLPVEVLRGRGQMTVEVAAQVERGQAIFAKQDCARCHAPPTYTSPESYDVGLVDELGNRKFNPPSLRGVSHRGPFFHDNRAATLEEVFTTQKHPAGTEMPAEDAADLATFLRGL